MILPHTPVYLSEVRVNDIWLLLGIGIVWELIIRFYLLLCKTKNNILVRKELQYKLLKVEVEYKRSLGIQAFVETSKLERQLLENEKELNKIYMQRSERVMKVEKTLIKYGNYILYIIIFFAYYTVPLLTVADVPNTLNPNSSLLKTMLFPITYVGIGIRISQFGLPSEIARNSVGSLFVLWSSQVTTGKIMDLIDSYYLS